MSHFSDLSVRPITLNMLAFYINSSHHPNTLVLRSRGHGLALSDLMISPFLCDAEMRNTRETETDIETY